MSLNDLRVAKLSRQLAEKANGLVYRVQGENHVNLIEGYAGNTIASDLVACIINGGGEGSGRENVIGGNTANVNTTNSNADPITLGTGANLARILGGYDNVVNALSAQISADHSKIEQGATHSSIIGGANHSILTGSDFSSINGGINHTISNDYAVIGGGSANTVSGHSGTIAGGGSNVVSAQSATISGGNNNQATGNYSSVSGGNYNVASGVSSVVNGGAYNQASADYAIVNGGVQNKATGQYASIQGGLYNEANNTYSSAKGNYAKSTFKGEEAFAVGRFAVTGDAQLSKLILRKQTTDATQSVISIDNQSTALTLPEDTTWGFTLRLVGRRTDVNGENGMWEIKGLIYRSDAGAATLVGTPIITEIAKSATATWSVVAQAVGYALYFKVTGETGKTINWVGNLELIQITG